MSPFSLSLHDLRLRNGLRQAELAELMGYEQSYISALEVGLMSDDTVSEKLAKLVKNC
ncbi:MAG TPA: helix-turn-helix transcriptional regulator [Macromonas sp.]|nr:helix-turn-helix transcriptional regulator [Macromonas sp.]